VSSVRLDIYTETPYTSLVHTVVETASYLRDAKRSGMTARDRHEAVQAVANDPRIGDLIEGTGGVRKFRLAGRGFGKSGGFRVIGYFGGVDVPVFLLAALSKGERANLSMVERNELKSIVAAIADDYPRGDDERKKEMSKFGNRLIEAAKEAQSIARGDNNAKGFRIHVPAEIDVKAMRQRLNLSQDEFAARFGFTAARIRDWEQGRSKPDGAVRAYLKVIERNPAAVKKALEAA
jgi:DNA-binding transcriptional regulator YiaG